MGGVMRYLSLFHGIGAVDVAWQPLGWVCVAYAEIEAFPIAVTKHHHPDIQNLGDVTEITDEQIAALGPIDLVVGGSPCQDLSVAGKRAGLAGARSGLFHEQLRIFDAARTLCGARWLLWENVPGAFSSHHGRDFGIVVSSMAGAEFAVPDGGWGTCGAAIGANGLVEWRVLDAQFVRVESHPRAVPQRRRRVFALLDSGNWRDRPPVLLEPEGLLGHPAPRREAGERVAPTIEARANAGGAGWGTDFMCGGGLAEVGRELVPAVCGALSDGAHMGGGLNGQDAYTGRIIPVAPLAFDLRNVTSAANRSNPQPGDACHTLHKPADSIIVQGEGITERDVALVRAGWPIAFSAKDHGADASSDVAPPLSADADKGDQDTLVAAVGFADFADPVAANQARTYTREGTNNFRVSNVAITPMQVRRLTPRECERLQGFPDDYTLIQVRGKPAADGPRYKALGNSMAVNVMRWIGERIESITKGGEA